MAASAFSTRMLILASEPEATATQCIKLGTYVRVPEPLFLIFESC